MSSRKQRKRDRRRNAGGDRETPPPAGERGFSARASSPFAADWKNDVRESCALVRQAIREKWATERGGEILAALTGDNGEHMTTTDMLRTFRLVLEIDRKSL